LRADAAASTASRPAFVTIASRPSGGETGRLIELILASVKAEYFLNRGWTGFADLPDRQFASQGSWPSSVIYLHPQSPTVDFIAAKPCIAVASRNCARTGDALKDCIVVVSSGLTVSELGREPTNSKRSADVCFGAHSGLKSNIA
jgi:hypothetical protein